MKLTALVPSRFLLLTCHLILLITIMQSRKENVIAGLPLDYNEKEYGSRDAQYLGGLIAGICLSILEFLGFITGLSMFAALPSLISAICHGSASIGLVSMIMDGWGSQLYWLIFTLGSIFPILIEIGIAVNVFVFKKNI